MKKIAKFFRQLINADLKFRETLTEVTDLKIDYDNEPLGDYLEINYGTAEDDNNCSRYDEPVIKKIDTVYGMTKLERQELIDRVRGMDEYELRVVVDNIPLELCLSRIAKECERLKSIEESLSDLMNLMT